MRFKVLDDEEFHDLKRPQDRPIPEEEATATFWDMMNRGMMGAAEHLAKFGEEGVAWSLPDRPQQCRVLNVSIYADALLTPELLPGIAAAIPKDGKTWSAELEFYTDAEKNRRDATPYCNGWAVIIGDAVSMNADFPELVGMAGRLGLEEGI